MRRRTMDIGDAPIYGVPEAAAYLDIPESTLRTWVSGRVYYVTGGKKYFHPVIDFADPVERQLSFYNLTEGHIISTFRRHYRIPIPKIRDAMDYLRGDIDHRHPLITQQFYLYGKDIIVKRMGASDNKTEIMINASKKGQLGIKEVLDVYLRRIKRTVAGTPIRLHPLRRNRPLDQPEVIEINPQVAFGNPVVTGTGVTLAMVLDRYRFGRSAEEIADDYDLKRSEVEKAIEYYREAA